MQFPSDWIKLLPHVKHDERASCEPALKGVFLMSEAPTKVEIGLKQFLETVPPGALFSVSECISDHGSYKGLDNPAVQLHCPSAECDGTTWFDYKSGDVSLRHQEWTFGIAKYVCRHCRRQIKWFALCARLDGQAVTVMKIGEYPPFGAPLPGQVLTLVGSDEELFKRGYRSETEGQGMGAYVYYRRVVDNQRARIFEEVILAAKAVNAPQQQIKELETAKVENRAIRDVKEAVPDSLLIGGQNPLTLLYKTLSEGIHDYSDTECLVLERDIRTVLTELAERIAAVTQNKEEVNSAVKRLLNRKQKPVAPQQSDGMSATGKS